MKGKTAIHAKETSHYERLFEAFAGNGAGKSPVWLARLRSEAIARFSALGFPTMREELWKYTNVGPIREIPFQLSDGKQVAEFTQDDLAPFLFGEVAWPRLVFVNGIYSPALSLLPQIDRSKCAADEPSFVGSLAEAISRNSHLLEAHLARSVAFDRNGFTALNTAFLQDGALIYLTETAAIEEPVHLIFISAASNMSVASNPRNLIVLSPRARCRIIENHVSVNAKEKCLTNAVTEIILGEGASLEHYQFLNAGENHYHVATTEIVQKSKSNLASFSIVLGTHFARSNLNVTLAGEEIHTTLNGFYYTQDREHVDHQTLIDHRQPRGTSRQLYKGLAAGKSSAVFGGKIFVCEGAQKTDAEQINQNLLLSKEAAVDTKPQLEIFADDVQCTHGAAVGQLEEEALFYLKSRGLDSEEARRILCYGFANEVVEKIQIESFRTYLAGLLLENLKDGKKC